MAEAEFFLDSEDELEVMNFIFENGGWFVPDIRYKTNEYIDVRNEKEYLGCREATRLFFILHQTYLKSPLEMRPCESQIDGQRFYFIMPRNGGPTLDFYCPKPFIKDEVLHLPPGALGYYPTFWNTTAERNEKTPQEVVGFYRQIVKQIRENSSQAVSNQTGRSFYLSERALKKLKNGAKLVGLEDFSLFEKRRDTKRIRELGSCEWANGRISK
ncbi:hypothetical protein HYR99_34625 [Candidatus Poribacteria bacterium]|nr:hypothetical protein [Candidatus Poribacteria bacterium]